MSIASTKSPRSNRDRVMWAAVLLLLMCGVFLGLRWFTRPLPVVLSQDVDWPANRSFEERLADGQFFYRGAEWVPPSIDMFEVTGVSLPIANVSDYVLTVSTPAPGDPVAAKNGIVGIVGVDILVRVPAGGLVPAHAGPTVRSLLNQSQMDRFRNDEAFRDSLIATLVDQARAAGLNPASTKLRSSNPVTVPCPK